MSDAHDVAGLQRAFGDPRSVDVDAVAAAEIAHDDGVAVNGEFGVAPRQQRIRFAQVAHRIAAHDDLADELQLAIASASRDNQLPAQEVSSSYVPPRRRQSAAAFSFSDAA